MKSLSLFTITIYFIFNASFSFCQNSYNGLDVILEACTNCLTNNPIYSGNDTMGTLDIISDFGPRKINSTCTYNFHGGIDYTVPLNIEDRGYHIRAVVGGEIYRIRDANTKYILIEGDEHNFSYIHIFRNGALPQSAGDLDIDYLDSYGPAGTNQNYRPCIVHRTATDTFVYAACPLGDCEDSYKLYNRDTISWNYFNDPQNQPDSVPIIGWDTLPAVNTVTQNLIIGSLGDSGATNASHLHLQMHNTLAGISAGATYSKSNFSDPLEFVAHQGPDFITTIHNEGNNNTIDNYPLGLEITYPGDNTTSFLVRATMPDVSSTGTINHGSGNNNIFFNNSMNIHQTKTLIKNSYTNIFTLISGPTYESKVNFGAVISNLQKYPTSPRSVLTSTFNGNWNRTGIDPRAYNTDCTGNYNRRWDDFYFADFVTRIHRDDPMDGGTALIANCPNDARYPDGRYDIFSEVTDVRGSAFQSDTLSFILDNWKPYLAKVDIRIGAYIIYEEEWECSDDCIDFSNNDLTTEITEDNIEQGISIFVKSSEQLESLSLTIPEWDLNDLAYSPPISQETDSINFGFFIPVEVIGHFGTTISLHFSGNDMSNNSLISFTEDNKSACTSVPFRNSSTTFQDDNTVDLVYGIDSIHGFYIGCAASDTLKGGETSSSRNSNYETTVNISSPPIFAPAIITHSYCYPECNSGSIKIVMDNSEDYAIEWSNGSTSFEIIKLGAGTYSYTITDNFCGFLEDEIEIECNPMDIQFQTTPSCDSDGTIQALISNGKSPFTFVWSDDTDETTANRSNLTSNTYTLTVSDNNGCTNSASVFIKDVDPINLEDMEYVIFDASCNVADGAISIFTPPSSGAPFSYAWSNGSSGNNQPNNGNILYNLSAGNYTVTITNAVGCEVATNFEVITINLPEIGIITVEHTCDGAEDGLISIPLSTNSINYTINWSNGETGYNITNLAQGIYTCTVTDNMSGCSIVESIEIEVKDLNSTPIVAETVTIPNCTGLNQDNGKIILTASGGIPPYTYHWSTGSNDKNIDNLGKGDYYVTITDVCGQIKIHSESVGVNEIWPNSSWELNFGEFNLMTNPEGGIPPYTYQWENGETTQNIITSNAGSYKVTITDSNGCIVEDLIEVEFNCIPLAVQLKTSPEGYDCDNNVLIRFDKKPGNTFLEGTAPFNVKIEQQINQEWVVLENIILSSLSKLSTYQFFFTSSGTFRATVIDNCGDSFEEVYKGCIDCNYQFYTGGNSNDKVYVDMFQGMITLEQVCPCSEDCDWGFTHDKIKLNVDENAIKNSSLPWNKFNFTIIWPGQNTENTTITKYWSGSQKKVKINGPTEYVLTTDEFYSGITIKVQYNLVQNNTINLQCQTDIPFTFGQLGYNGYFSVFEIDPGYFNPFPEYGRIFNIGTIACSTKCSIPLLTGELYANEPDNFEDQSNYGSMCESDPDDPLIFFRYIPIDYADPCTGGGTLESHYETENGIVRGLKYIPYGVAIDEYLSIPYPLFSDDNSYAEYSCPSSEFIKGYCLFDAMDVYGINLNHKLLVEYCEGSMYDPPIDTDGDGLPDDIDPCPTNPDILCKTDEDGDGTNNTGGNTDENGCVTNFHPQECQLSKVCPGEETEYREGFIENETHEGMNPCIHCFSADICRVIDPKTGIEYSSITGPLLNQVQYTIVDDDTCPNYCAYQYTCLITGNVLGKICIDVGCGFTPEAWRPMCQGEEYDGVISLQNNEDGSQNFQTWMTEYQALSIVNQKRELKIKHQLTLFTFPNPSLSSFSIRINSPKNQNRILYIKNILGEEVYSRNIALTKGNNNRIDIEHNFISGLYYISVIDVTGNRVTTKHIIQ